ncbi:MAG TPA: hypothetical protein PKN09_02715 [Novosphingobium sp.]|nr:hypothetical protein [Novosphingobium sp.]
MARHFKTLFALSALTAPAVALACADPGCEGGFNLIGNQQTCQGRAMLAPGNDSRINLMFLLADKGGRVLAPVAASDEDRYSYINTPSVFLDWQGLRSAYFPVSAESGGNVGPSYSGSRCQTYTSGGEALGQAMAANRALPAAERSALLTARSQTEEVCKLGTAWERQYKKKSELAPLPVYGQWPAVASQPGREFLGYLQAAEAFYGDRFDVARQGFADLAKAGDPWVRETAAYMLIRVEFAAAQAAAANEYGDYVGEKVDRAAVKRGLGAVSGYLGAYPKGRYTTSAVGLLRRGLWLAGDYDALGGTYAKMLDRASASDKAAAELVEEVDIKLLFDRGAKGAGAKGPMLLAAQTLVALRDQNYDDDGTPRPTISAAQIDALEPQFAGHAELFSYLQATHAFYYAKDYRRVLTLIPDDARRAEQSNLSFSRQMLRGMALAALGDRNEAGFWQELIPGAKGAWQRPLAELGLAMNWERTGKLDAVFASGSPITNREIRGRLIDRSVGPVLLRSITGNKGNAGEERDFALYTLLANELVMGHYAPFGADVKLPVADSKNNAAIFTKGKVSDGYPCAPLAVTVAALAKNPQDVAGRLCLGDFFRMHGLDYLHGEYDVAPKKDELGGYAVGFSGKRNFRSEFYTSIIANPAAGANDKAYALYRAVMCYAPSGINDCGGAEVPKSQRKAWFDRLKRDYPQSQWAKKLRYYW